MNKPKTNVPRCVGIILDGNRRWARARGRSALEGHNEGKENLKRIARAARERGIEHLIVYAFSMENWNRSDAEVEHLMNIFRNAVSQEFHTLGEEGVRIRFVGQKERLSQDLQKAITEVEEETQKHAFTLWICLSYGGRAEIVAAAQAAAREGAITEESIQRFLWTTGMPDPDIIIRPGGDQRLSNFLPWQSIYSELFFMDTFWPDFSENDLDSVLAEFNDRERRHGR